ncbi:unnamed protein product [Nyctereutes procyonoides]|uniref:(raccoon dog) hypothetical protein n=1 Tax=Nyctereutes procyonoides TaxID=34880 RepID=A0A811ZZE2_NYCPR|nr:unnamed protein product [Nyctereutes procyonoides]
MLRAMRCACSRVPSRLTLKAMRNFRAPVAVAPQRGTKELGPKSGTHSACLSWGETHRASAGPSHAPAPMRVTPRPWASTAVAQPPRATARCLPLLLPGCHPHEGPRACPATRPTLQGGAWCSLRAPP